MVLQVTTQHLQRSACLYVRQSTLQQVLTHTESTARQYRLRERAVALGWAEEQIIVIDQDLGQSGASMADRLGFQRLVTEVGLGRVGLVLGLEVSRLARNSSDWHHLLEICALTQTLILDEDGVYDPATFNDRLLLGLKGTMSEAELYVMRARLAAGRLSKVARGEYIQHLPTGLVRVAGGRVEFDPDEQVRQVIALVLSTFAEVGSGLKTLEMLKRHDILLPRHQTNGLHQGELLWKVPPESMIVDILHNPAYAGAFVYGRRPTDPIGRKPGRRGTGVVRKPMEEWITIQHGVYPAYISWEQYMANQVRLADNTQQAHARYEQKGAVRQGAALLQGLMYCGQCGYRMRSIYKPQVRYACDGLRRHYADKTCVSLDGASIEAEIVQAFFAALQPAQLNALTVVLDHQAQERAAVEQYWTAQVQRAQYDAHLARRRYEAVDPDNRLVARELEKRWEAQLLALRHTEEQAERVLQPAPAVPLTAAMRQQLEDIAHSLPNLWPTLAHEDQKTLLRTLIQRVIATRQAPDRVELKVVWVSGHYSVVQIVPPIHRQADVSNYEQLLDRIRSLTGAGWTDTAIAHRLNEEGFHTARCLKIT